MDTLWGDVQGPGGAQASEWGTLPHSRRQHRGVGGRFTRLGGGQQPSADTGEGLQAASCPAAGPTDHSEAKCPQRGQQGSYPVGPRPQVNPVPPHSPQKASPGSPAPTLHGVKGNRTRPSRWLTPDCGDQYRDRSQGCRLHLGIGQH